jgi:hypothetical protein
MPSDAGCVAGYTCQLFALQVYIFGGMTIDGHLLNDLWALDLDSMTWSHCTCYGLAPSARKGKHYVLKEAMPLG